MYPLIKMWKILKTDEKGDETQYAHDTKVLYCKYKFEDIYDEKNLTDFAKWLHESITNGTIEWKYKRIPHYKTIESKWFDRWDWEGCAKAYEEEMTQPLQNTARLIFEKRMLEDTITDFKTIDKLDDRNDRLFRDQKLNGTKNDYQIAKNEETKNSIWRRICDRLNLNSDTEIPEDAPNVTLPIVDNPVWLDKNALAARNAFIWENLPKRGEG